MLLVASCLVLAAGLYVGWMADAAPDMRIFGGVLAVIGALGLTAAVVRRRIGR